MEKGTGTRSGLLWEVERILAECDNKPQVLVMENVTNVHGASNEQHFKEWQLRLEEMGYQSYWEDMSAVDYGIPQTRNRTFMVSILGNYHYKFPRRIKLKLRLKDLLESKVDEKYYLSDKMINYISANNDKWSGNNDKALINKEVASTINTGEGSRRCDASNYIGDNLPEDYDLKYGLTKHLKETFSKNHIKDCKDGDVVDAYNKSIVKNGTYPTVTAKVPASDDKYVFESKKDLNYSEESLRRIKKNVIEGDIAGTITANAMQSINHQNCALVIEEKPKVINPLKDKTDKSWLFEQQVYDDEGVARSIKASEGSGNIPKVITKQVPLKRGYSCEVKEEQEDTEQIDFIGNYSKSNFNQTSIVGKNGVAPTVTENHGQVTAITENQDIKPKVIGGVGEMKSNGGQQFYQQDQVYDGSVSISLATGFNPNYQVGLRIRKLTPKECFRLQGLKDEDIALVMEHQTNSGGYHLAGDSIEVTCLLAIFSQMLGLNWQDYFIPKEWWHNE